MKPCSHSCHTFRESCENIHRLEIEYSTRRGAIRADTQTSSLNKILLFTMDF